MKICRRLVYSIFFLFQFRVATSGHLFFSQNQFCFRIRLQRSSVVLKKFWVIRETNALIRRRSFIWETTFRKSFACDVISCQFHLNKFPLQIPRNILSNDQRNVSVRQGKLQSSIRNILNCGIPTLHLLLTRIVFAVGQETAKELDLPILQSSQLQKISP